jgi:thymidylate kinase
MEAGVRRMSFTSREDVNALRPESRRILGQLFRAFDRAGVIWCVLRREDELDRFDGDVDLLVHPESLELCRRVAAEAGLVELPASGRGSHTFFLGFDSEGAWLQLDVVSQLAFGRLFALETDAAERCLVQRRQADGLFLLAPGDAFWALLLHCLLDKRSLAASDRIRLQALSASVGQQAADSKSPLLRAVLHACPRFDASQLLAAVQRGDWETATTAGIRLSRMWWRRRALSAAGAGLTNLLGRLGERFSISRGGRWPIVAFLGIDGAGKSTLVAALREDFPVPVRTIYGGLWRSSGSRGFRATVTTIARPVLRPAVIWLQYMVARYHQALGRLVLLDRYAYDAYLPPSGALRRLKRAYLSFLVHIAPPLDLVILLDVPGIVAAQRKPEDAAALLESQRRSLLLIRGRVRGLEIVDGARDFATVKREAAEHIWCRFSRGAQPR